MTASQRKIGRPSLEAAGALKTEFLEHALRMLCDRGIAGATIEALAAGLQQHKQIRPGDARMFALLLDLLQGAGYPMKYGYPDDHVRGGLSQDAYFVSRWSAFLACAGCEVPDANDSPTSPLADQASERLSTK